MCYPKPGPRCANHINKAMQKTEALISEAVKSGDKKALASLKEEQTKNMNDFSGTRSGQKALAEKIDREDDPYIKKSLESYKEACHAEYNAKLNEYKKISANATGGGVQFNDYNKALEVTDTFRKEATARAAEYITNHGTDRGEFQINQSDGSTSGYHVVFSQAHNFEARGYEKTVPVSLYPWHQNGRIEHVNLPADIIQGNSDSDNTIKFSEYNQALETTDKFRNEASNRAADYIAAHGTDRGKFQINQSGESKDGYRVAFSPDHNFEARGYEKTVPVSLYPWNQNGRIEQVNLPADIVQGK